MHCNTTATLGVPGSALLATFFFVVTAILLYQTATLIKKHSDVIGLSLLHESAHDPIGISNNDDSSDDKTVNNAEL